MHVPLKYWRKWDRTVTWHEDPRLPELSNCQILKTFASENIYVYHVYRTSSQLYLAVQVQGS